MSSLRHQGLRLLTASAGCSANDETCRIGRTKPVGSRPRLKNSARVRKRKSSKHRLLPRRSELNGLKASERRAGCVQQLLDKCAAHTGAISSRIPINELYQKEGTNLGQGIDREGSERDIGSRSESDSLRMRRGINKSKH